MVQNGEGMRRMWHKKKIKGGWPKDLILFLSSCWILLLLNKYTRGKDNIASFHIK